MEVIVFEGELRMGDSRNATMVFAQDFRAEQCAGRRRELIVECDGVQILGQSNHLEVSSHMVYVDATMIGRIRSDRTLFATLPLVEAGVHRVRVEVSPFPGFGLCDDFTLKRIIFRCD